MPLKRLELNNELMIYSNYTDDYEDGTSDFNQVVSLYSFDEQENLVQYISRDYHSYFSQEGFVYKDYMPDFSEENWTHVVFDENEKAYYIDFFAMDGHDPINIYEGLTAKQSLQYELTEKGQHEGYYFSKP